MKIEVCNLNKKFNNNVIFKDYSLTIEQNEFVVILGKSGCGKTTLLNMIGTLENYDSGKIIYTDDKGINNFDVSNDKRVLRNKYINFIFQNFILLENETVKKNLIVAVDNKNKANAKELITNVLTKLSLEDRIDSKVCELSGGEQQRIAFARAMVKECDVILCDEPTGNLDEANAIIIFEIFKQLHNEGKTIVVVTHDKKFVKYATKVIEL